MKEFLFVVLFLICNQIVIAQEKPDSKDKKWTESESKQLEKAEFFFSEKNYRLALPIYQRLLESHADDIKLKYSVAVCGYSYPGLQKISLDYLEQAYAKNKKAHEIEFNLAKAYYYNERFEEALKMGNAYLAKNQNAKEEVKKEITDFISVCTAAKQLAEHPVNVKINNLGNVINSAAAESSPCFSADGDHVIFTYKGEKSSGGLQNPFNQPDKNGVYFEDVYESHLMNGIWQTPVSLKNVNGKNNEAALCLSNEAKALYIAIDSPQDDGDIYQSKFENGDWALPVKLRGLLNSSSWEDNCSLSPDGKVLFFSSNRPGGFGGKDIYQATLMPDSTWGNVKNLGDKINTALDDDAPFLHYDGQLFLFSSRGHGSIGGYDIFRSNLNTKDSTWSNPENLGYPINSPNDENHYILSNDAQYGYYGIGRTGGFGDLDIYSVEPGIVGAMPKVLVVKGKVFLDTSLVSAEITIEIPSENKVLRTLITNDMNKNYSLTLPLGEDYKITWKVDKQEPKSEMISTVNVQEYLLKEIDVHFGRRIDSTLAIESNSTDTLGMVNGHGHPSDSLIGDLVFKIQVSAQSINRKLKQKLEEKFSQVEEKEFENELKFMLKKEIPTLNEALEEVEKVRQVAPDAFIVGFYKNKRYHLYQLREKGLLPPKIKKQLLP